MRDHNGQVLAYVYFEDEPGRRSAAKLLERDEARRIAVKIANAGATEPPSNWSRLRVSAASVPPVRRPALPWSLAASARLDAEGLMAVAAVLADGLKIRLQSIEVLGIALRRFDVVGKFGDCRLEVVHSFQ
jgi:hypothetical protein